MPTEFRDESTSEERALDLELTIDPGFVHHRRIQTIIGQMGMNLIDEGISRLPSLPEWQKKVGIDHIY